MHTMLVSWQNRRRGNYALPSIRH